MTTVQRGWMVLGMRETMSQVGAWLSTLVQQALAILLGGLVAVGWGRDFADWVKGTVEDLGSQWIAYIDVPSDSGNEAYYYIGTLPLERPTVRDGHYRTYRKVSDPYVRYVFIPTCHIRSRRELYRSLMTGLLTQGDGYIHLLQGHPLRPINTPPHEWGRFSRPAGQAQRATVPAPARSA